MLLQDCKLRCVIKISISLFRDGGRAKEKDPIRQPDTVGNSVTKVAFEKLTYRNLIRFISSRWRPFHSQMASWRPLASASCHRGVVPSFPGLCLNDLAFVHIFHCMNVMSQSNILLALLVSEMLISEFILAQYARIEDYLVLPSYTWLHGPHVDVRLGNLQFVEFRIPPGNFLFMTCHLKPCKVLAVHVEMSKSDLFLMNAFMQHNDVAVDNVTVGNGFVNGISYSVSMKSLELCHIGVMCGDALQNISQ